MGSGLGVSGVAEGVAGGGLSGLSAALAALSTVRMSRPLPAAAAMIPNPFSVLYASTKSFLSCE